MGANDFRELDCWQLAQELKIEVFAFTRSEPARHDWDFCRDIRRAARSAPANIAEGFGRRTHRDFANYLSIAIASLREVANHLEHATDEAFLTAPEVDRLMTLAERARRASTSLATYLLNTPDRPRRRAG